jgi:hypothetical protein
MKRNPFIAGFLAWLLPGAGHFYAGRRQKAYVLFGCITSLFVVGTLIAGGRNVSWYQYPLTFCGQFFVGAPFLAALGVTSTLPYDAVVDRMIEAGKLYGIVAGLLNIIAATDAIETARKGDEC